MTEMTIRRSHRSDKKGAKGRRMTPRDVEVAGTFSETPRPPRDPPRGPTAAEARANNAAKSELGRRMARELFEIIAAAPAELAEMNAGKVGRPYEFTDGLIGWLSGFQALTDCDYRFASGFVGGIMEHFGQKAPSPSRLLERLEALTVGLYGTREENSGRHGEGFLAVMAMDDPGDRPRDLGIDGSGLTTTNPNGWRLRKWGEGPKEAAWPHIHALCDLDSGEFVAMAVATPAVGDATAFGPVVRAAVGSGCAVKRLFGDGAYGNSGRIWRMTEDMGIEFVSSFRSNTTPTNNGSPARGRAARVWCSTEYHVWTKRVGYGRRWKSEGGYSDFKEIFPESMRARGYAGMVRVIGARFRAYNRYKHIRAEIMGTTGNGVRIGRGDGASGSDAEGIAGRVSHHFSIIVEHCMPSAVNFDIL